MAFRIRLLNCAFRRSNFRLLCQALQKRWIDPVNLEEQLQNFAMDSKEINQEAMHRNRAMHRFERVPAIQWFMRNEQGVAWLALFVSFWINALLTFSYRYTNNHPVESSDEVANWVKALAYMHCSLSAILLFVFYLQVASFRVKLYMLAKKEDDFKITNSLLSYIVPERPLPRWLWRSAPLPPH